MSEEKREEKPKNLMSGRPLVSDNPIEGACDVPAEKRERWEG
jgi:hypothetical protein